MLEDRNLLDPGSEIDLFALHYIYLPRINNALKVFQDSYSHHHLHTAIRLFKYGLPVLWRDIMTMLYNVWKIL